MMHPSYSDLIATVNEDAVNEGEEPVVQSRYSIVLAAAKRARQLVAGAQPLVEPKDMKPVTLAIEEVNRGLLTYRRNLEDEEL